MPRAQSGRNRFAEVPSAEIQRSRFDRSHGYKTTFDAGYLVPVFVDEVLPGDTFNLRMTAFARLATPLKPFMDNLTMESFFFFVPYRLVWNNFAKFFGEQTDPGDPTDFLVPQMHNGAGWTVGSLGDYYGIPLGIAVGEGDFSHSSLPFRAFNLIWREWFRDQNLQDSPVVDLDDGPDEATDYIMRRRGKRHDYFTSCLPWPQKGDSVSVPIGTSADVVSDAALADTDYLSIWSTSGTDQYRRLSTDPAVGEFLRVSSTGGLEANKLYADLSSATAATINQLRQAFQVQRLLERDARGGTRYTEIVRAHFRVRSPDARLQRPEYLGGGSSPVTISPVPQTSEDGTTPQGNLAAYGTLSANGHGFVSSFTEHGVVIGMVSVRADLTYQQGLERMWSRQTRYDFYWPALSHIGEQAVLQQEIFASASNAQNQTVFGYQERYAEYRYKPARITGLFRSDAAGTLDVWHLAQDFSAAPTLSDAFIQDDPPVDRVIAVPTEPHFLFDAYFKLTCARPMPVYGVPGLIDHF